MRFSTRRHIPALLACLFFPVAVLADPPRIVTDIAPVQALVAEVTGDLATPAVLMPAGTDPHSFQLRPSQARRLAASDLVIWVGPALTPWLHGALRNLSPDATSLALMELDGMPLILENGAAQTDTRRALFDPAPVRPRILETEHGDSDDHAHHHGALDPHVWLDPANGAFVMAAVAGILSDLDPDNAATYAANAARGIDRLRELDTALRAQLAPLGETLLVTGHDAFAYFFARYGLDHAISLADSDAAAPGVARLREVRAAMEAAVHGCLVAEAGQAPDMLRKLDAGQDFPLVTLDPLGRDPDPAPGHYAALLAALGGGLAGCRNP